MLTGVHSRILKGEIFQDTSAAGIASSVEEAGLRSLGAARGAGWHYSCTVANDACVDPAFVR